MPVAPGKAAPGVVGNARLPGRARGVAAAGVRPAPYISSRSLA